MLKKSLLLSAAFFSLYNNAQAQIVADKTSNPNPELMIIPEFGLLSQKEDASATSQEGIFLDTSFLFNLTPFSRGVSLIAGPLVSLQGSTASYRFYEGARTTLNQNSLLLGVETGVKLNVEKKLNFMPTVFYSRGIVNDMYVKGYAYGYESEKFGLPFGDVNQYGFNIRGTYDVNSHMALGGRIGVAKSRAHIDDFKIGSTLLRGQDWNQTSVFVGASAVFYL